MKSIQQILTELVLYAKQVITWTPGIDGAISTAITNATEQIEAQQRERVEKLRTALSTASTWPDGEPVSAQGVLSLSVTALRDEGHKSLAFELEAVKDKQKTALKELEAGEYPS